MAVKKRKKKCNPLNILRARSVGFYYWFKTEQPLDTNAELIASKMTHKTRKSKSDIAYFLHHFPLITDKLKLKWRVDYVFDFAVSIGDKLEEYSKEYRICHFGTLDEITLALDAKIDNILFNQNNPDHFQLATVRAEVIGTKAVDDSDYTHEFKKI